MKYNALIEKIQIAQDMYNWYKETNACKEAINPAAERLIKAKREYRAWLKNENKKRFFRPDTEWGEIINGSWSYDSGWQKIFFAGEHWSDEEKEEFINANWKRPVYSQYDCTGCIFTVGIEVFNVPSGVLVFILEAIDV